MRDKLIKLICDCEKQWRYPVGNSYLFDYGKLADYLISHGVTFADVSVNNVGKWIPVSERLPTERGRYWTWCKFYVMERKVELPYVRYFSPKPNAFTLDGVRNGEVTHWMPIVPPKEGK